MATSVLESAIGLNVLPLPFTSTLQCHLYLLLFTYLSPSTDVPSNPRIPTMKLVLQFKTHFREETFFFVLMKSNWFETLTVSVFMSCFLLWLLSLYNDASMCRFKIKCIITLFSTSMLCKIWIERLADVSCIPVSGRMGFRGQMVFFGFCIVKCSLWWIANFHIKSLTLRTWHCCLNGIIGTNDEQMYSKACF